MEEGRGKNGIEYMTLITIMILEILIKVLNTLDLSWVVQSLILILAD